MRVDLVRVMHALHGCVSGLGQIHGCMFGCTIRGIMEIQPTREAMHSVVILRLIADWLKS